jgi:monoterpene epsilon-lactone hydrolase
VRSHGSQLYSIRIAGHLGATSLAAFPEMAVQQRCVDCILTGVLPDRSALYGIVAQIEALGLELVEIRRIEPDGDAPARER